MRNDFVEIDVTTTCFLMCVFLFYVLLVGRIVIFGVCSLDELNPLFLRVSIVPAQYSSDPTAAAAGHDSSEIGIGSLYTGTPVFCAPPFQLATPPRFRANDIPKGNHVKYKICLRMSMFFHLFLLFSLFHRMCISCVSYPV